MKDLDGRDFLTNQEEEGGRGYRRRRGEGGEDGQQSGGEGRKAWQGGDGQQSVGDMTFKGVHETNRLTITK